MREHCWTDPVGTWGPVITRKLGITAATVWSSCCCYCYCYLILVIFVACFSISRHHKMYLGNTGQSYGTGLLGYKVLDSTEKRRRVLSLSLQTNLHIRPRATIPSALFINLPHFCINMIPPTNSELNENGKRAASLSRARESTSGLAALGLREAYDPANGQKRMAIHTFLYSI